MSAPTKPNGPFKVSTGTLLGAGAMALWVTAMFVSWGGLKFADVLTGSHHADGGPGASLNAVMFGDAQWGVLATIGALLTAGVIGAAGYGAWWGWRRWARPERDRTDLAARHMGAGKEIAVLTKTAVAKKAERLGVADSPGLPIAVSVAGGVPLYASFEDVQIDIWGPRRGKSTSRVIPMILAAPGAVMTTSNKRDVVDATRDVRRDQMGEEPWVYDPQGIAGEEPTWYWDPVTYVHDERTAQTLAGVFTDASRSASARTDAYFDGAALNLGSGLLLAAHCAGRDLDQVYRWITDPTDEAPVRYLKAGGFEFMALAVQDVMRAPDKQRAGVYGSAQQTFAFVLNRQAMAWARPGPGKRPFNPAAFVRSQGTLYSLSKEGRGSAGPLTTALTVAVTEAAEEYAKTLPGGRLRVPMVVPLDEVANVCRWRELPDMYSHYGSRGICVASFLQSWAQGVEVWGQEGMAKLWSAANVRVYGGGNTETQLLSDLSRIIGEYERVDTSRSTGNGDSFSHQVTRQQILAESDLASLPMGRAVVFASGARPTLVRTTPWMEGPHREAIQRSMAAHEPAGQTHEQPAGEAVFIGELHQVGEEPGPVQEF